MAMNAQFLGPYDVAPRSHPNDGKLDVVARRSGDGSARAAAGAAAGAHGHSRSASAHLDHGRSPSVDLDFDRAAGGLDRRRALRHGAPTCAIIVEPDAFTAYV